MDESTKQLLPFVVVSIIMFFSILFGSTIAGLGLLLWFVTLGWTLSKTILKDITVGEILTVNDKKEK